MTMQKIEAQSPEAQSANIVADNIAKLKALESRYPFGRYAEQAQRIGAPDAVRAVGAANGRNPLPVILPCHRVIGQSGNLTGYAGGLPIKQALLHLEGIQH